VANWETASTLQVSTARTTSGTTSAIDLGAVNRLLRQQLNVTAFSGTAPTCDVRLECSADGVDGWKSFANFARAQSLYVERITAISPERYVRVAWTLGGTTPSFTFDVDGKAGISYANLVDLDTHGLPAAAVASVTQAKRCEALAAASEEADGKLAVRFDLPLSAWGVDLTKCIAKIAAYEILSVRGFNPDGADANVRDRYLDAMKWLDGVAKGSTEPIGIVDASPTEEDASGIEVVTHAARAWR
jgi:phage gp36-like protein